MKADFSTVTKKYDVLYMDPPWSYTGSKVKWGAAAKFYDTMSLDEIKSMPLKKLCKRRAVVFVWTTGPKLAETLEAGRAWGLHYRGVAFVWVKTKKDGTPLKAQGVRPSIVKPITELCLMFSTIKSGKPLPLASESICQTVFAPKRRHSQKPVEVRERIEQLYPTSERIELFARERPTGWDVWGDEVPPLTNQQNDTDGDSYPPIEAVIGCKLTRPETEYRAGGASDMWQTSSPSGVVITDGNHEITMIGSEITAVQTKAQLGKKVNYGKLFGEFKIAGRRWTCGHEGPVSE